MLELWCPFAIRLNGPPEKTGYRSNEGPIDRTHAKVGVTLHSMEYESTPEWDDATTLHNALFSTREASWTFSIVKFFGGALLFQHYPIGAVCWAQGYQGNLWLDSIESEGIAPGKFTEAQVALLVRTLRWIKEAHGWGYWIPHAGDRSSRFGYDDGGILFEHNAVPGAPATNCAVFTHRQVDPVRLLVDLEDDMDEATVRGIVDKALKPVLRALELQQENAGDMALFKAWQDSKGTPQEAANFWAFVNGPIAWRLLENGWTVPA